MTLNQISSWISRAIRMKLHPDQIVLIMDAAQRMAFDSRELGFVSWNQTLTPKYYIEFVYQVRCNISFCRTGNAYFGMVYVVQWH